MCLGLQSRVRRAVACCSSDSSTSGPTSDTRSLPSGSLSSRTVSLARLLSTVPPSHVAATPFPPCPCPHPLFPRPQAQMAGIDLNPESRSPGKTYPADTYLPTRPPSLSTCTYIQRTITRSRTPEPATRPTPSCTPRVAGKCISARRATDRVNARARASIPLENGHAPPCITVHGNRVTIDNETF